MKSLNPPANGHHYTAREIMEILDRARALGVTFLKVDGFEAVWEIEKADALHREAAPPAREAHATDRPTNERPNRCDVCGDDMVRGNWGQPYCVACYKRKKEREGQRR